MTQRVSNTPSLTSFVFAKEFRKKSTGEIHQYPQNRLESVGNNLRWMLGRSTDLLLREIKNPITIIALTSLALFSVTIAFYPSSALLLAAKLLPPLSHLKPWMLKLTLYIATQSTILGVGLRSLGRFNNEALFRSWKRSELEAVFIGDRR